jgi:hypothetical protein
LKDFKKKTYPNGLVEHYSNVVEFRDLFAKQLEIKIRTLIAKDSEKDEDHSINTTPNLEFELIDPYTQAPSTKGFTAKSRILVYNEKDLLSLPDYAVEPKKKELFLSINKNYYRDYIEFVFNPNSVLSEKPHGYSN